MSLSALQPLISKKTKGWHCKTSRGFLVPVSILDATGGPYDDVDYAVT